ncbi:Crp/Fnr family transcriptional regulator [Paenibacillus sp. Z6-24]
MQPEYNVLRQMAIQAGVTAEEWETFWQKTSLRHIRSGQRLIEAGQPVDFAHFCVQGLFRLYYILEDGREYTAGFTMEQDYATSYAAMITGQPSAYTIEALEAAVVIEIPYQLLEQLMHNSHGWERFVRVSVERLYIRKEERERELLYASARERYDACLRKYPGLEKRVPQYHIASYIGVSPVSLSRLLRRDSQDHSHNDSP